MRHPLTCINLVCGVGIALVCLVDLVRYLTYGSWLSFLTVLGVDLCSIILCALTVATGCSPVLLLVAALNLLVGNLTNNPGTAMDNTGFYLEAGLALLGACAGSLIMILRRPRLNLAGAQRPLAVLVILCLAATAAWQAGSIRARHDSQAGPNIWEVPERFQSQSRHPGTVRSLTYQTRAYGSDGRRVEKTAYVYLPYHYDCKRPYNILYLMHGTGDSSSYWLKDHPENKRMVDQLIDQHIIAPLIIVTPSFYVENDAKNHLDTLTYSFAKELRRDLMPAVESRYSTYARGGDEKAFQNSRDHRGFAGLSRGAVTTYHSAMEQCLDCFSWFGAFSGSRTSAQEFLSTAGSKRNRQYPIHYLYVSSGTFDFAQVGQLHDYRNLLQVEPRLYPGQNTRFDIYPMRYHSSESWHLALYNSLQCFFRQTTNDS